MKEIEPYHHIIVVKNESCVNFPNSRSNLKRSIINETTV